MCSSVVSSVLAGSGPNAIVKLPGLKEPLNDHMFTGYLDTNDGYGSQLFYWLSMARNNSKVASDTPVVLWLQGGPGCSGGLGWFLENGPFMLQADGSLLKNRYSWNENAHFLFIDQPIGTGLSTPPKQATNFSYTTTIEQSTEQLWNALQQFFGQHFPQIRNNPFTITGESYAGKYIPYLSNMILDRNANKDYVHINLKSIAIGNGWVDPLTQTSVYGEQAYALGLIDEPQRDEVDVRFAKCSDLVKSHSWSEAQQVCDDLLGWIIEQAGNLNVDDVRTFEDDEPDERLETYLSSPDVQYSLHLLNPPTHYQSCNDAVGKHFAQDEMMDGAVHILPRLVKELNMVYLYEGIFDLNCGVIGVQKYLQNLYPREMHATSRIIWTSDDLKLAQHRAGNSSTAVSRSKPAVPTVYGYVRQLLPSLTFIVVQGAGHLVPKDQPQSSFDMIAHLLTDTPFTDTRARTRAASVRGSGVGGSSGYRPKDETRRTRRRFTKPHTHAHAQPSIVINDDATHRH